MIAPLPSQPAPPQPRRLIAAIVRIASWFRGKPRRRGSGPAAPTGYPSQPSYSAPTHAAPIFSAPIYNSPPIVLPPAPAAAMAWPVPPPAPAAPAAPLVGLTAGGVSLNTSTAFKSVLSLTELQWVGLRPTLHEAEVTVEDGNGVLASWTGDGDASGAIELDLFSAKTGDAATILKAVIKHADGTPAALQLTDADEAYQAETDQSAWLAARRGPLVFALSIPAGPRAGQQLAYLGGLVLHRVTAG